MNPTENDTLRSVAAEVIKRRTGAETDDLFAAARRTYDDLAGVLVPLIGSVGVDAIASRALNIAQREYPADPAKNATGSPGDDLVAWLGHVDPSAAGGAAAAMLAALGGLLETFIGESLTRRLLRKAWPDAFQSVPEEETHP